MLLLCYALNTVIAFYVLKIIRSGKGQVWFMNVYMKMGLIVGLAIGLVIIVILLKVTKTDGDMKCKYDERQSGVRGKGFRLGFFTLMIYDAVYGLMNALLEKPLLDTSSAMVLGICLSIAVYAVYCIWNDAYFSLNENPRKLLFAFGAIGLCNLVLGAVNIINGTAITNGMMNFRGANLTCGIMFIVVFAALLAKKVRNGNGEQEAV